MFVAHRPRSAAAFSAAIACALLGSFLTLARPGDCAAATPPPATNIWAAVDVPGMPPSRTYTFQEIGNVTAGVRLAGDALGRLTVVREGAYIVFDDNQWTDMLDGHDSNRNISCAVRGPDGTMYCGGAGLWGFVEYKPDGLVKVHSLRPATCPDWVSNNICEFIVFTPQAVAFAGRYGVVTWNRATGAQRFQPVPQIASVFALRQHVYIASFTGGLFRLDPVSGEFKQVGQSSGRAEVIEHTTVWDDDHVLVVNSKGEAFLFDGRKSVRWRTEVDDLLAAGVSQVQKLSGGNVAIAVRPQMLVIVDAQGRRVLAAEDPRFAGVNDICATEPGLVWLSSTEGLTKVMSDSPVSIYDHRVGLDLYWPQVISHQGKPLIVSAGKIFVGIPGENHRSPRFHPVETGLHQDVYSAVSTPHGLLIGTSSALYALDAGGGMKQVLSGFAAERLEYTDPETETCLIVGTSAIAAVQWKTDHWQEIGTRIPGVGFPSAVFSLVPRSVWLELGVGRVARITFRDEQVSVRLVDKFPWGEQRWVNVGAIGSKIILTQGNLNDHRLFFDERTNAFGDAPELTKLLAAAPFEVLRPQPDAFGSIWTPYPKGLFRLLPSAGGYRAEVAAYNVASEPNPTLFLTNGRREVWVRSRQLLMRIDPQATGTALREPRPVLTRLADARTNRDIYNALAPDEPALRNIPFRSNSLNFHFFPGTYSLLRTPSYQYRLEGYSDQWSVPVPDSTVRITSLREGSYRMTVRLVDNTGPIGEATSFGFTIAPPFYRRWYAYATYTGALAALLLGAGWWLLRRAERRNEELEALVNIRTEELRIALQAGEIGTWQWNVANGEFKLSQRGEHIFGIAAGEARTYERFLAALDPADAARSRSAMQTALETRHDCEIEVCAVWPDKTMHWVNLVGRGYHEDQGAATRMEGVVIDVTERRRAEHDRQTLSKLESTGLLAAGIAHDFNNLLAAILLDVEMALDGSSVEMARALRRTSAAVQTAKSLTGQLITFSAGSLSVRQPVNLARLVRETADKWLADCGMTTEIAVDPGTPDVLGDSEMLGLALRNLLLNAREASAKGSAIRLRVEQTTVTEREIATLAPGPYARITVQDHGRGIDASVLPKIFDPYFSTKQRGTQKGMGLGLTICLSIAQRHGGTVTVSSIVGQGTSVHVYLSLATRAVTPNAPARNLRVDRPLRVLVMDDEDALREALGRALRGFGHEVDATRGGAETVERYAESMRAGRRYDVIFLDLTIPGGMGGEEALRAIQAIDPGVRAIVMSGYTQSTLLDDHQRYGFKAALIKPFTREMLAESLGQAMG